MVKNVEFKDVSPRSFKINQLQKRLEKVTETLKRGYTNTALMLRDLGTFEFLEKEIEIQKCYRDLEESYWNS